MSFCFQEKKRKQDSFKHHVHIFPISTAETYCYNVSLQKPTNRKKLHGRWKTAWVLPFKLWTTIIQLHRFKKETLAFICTKASCKALFRSCRETCPLLDFLKSTLALTSSLRRRWVSEPHSASVCDFQVVLARLWMWARTLRASFSNFISILGLKRSFKWHFAHSYLSLDCNDTALWETCPSCLSRACAAHPPLYYIGFKVFLFAKSLDIGLLSACWGGTEQDQKLGCCVPHSPKVIVDEKILFVLEVWWLWVGLFCQECTFNR